MSDLLNPKTPRVELLEPLLTFASRLAAKHGERISIEIKLDGHSWNAARSCVQRPYKQKPLYEFTLYGDYGTIRLWRDEPTADYTPQPVAGETTSTLGYGSREEDYAGWHKMVKDIKEGKR